MNLRPLLIACVLLTAVPAIAQDTEPPPTMTSKEIPLTTSRGRTAIAVPTRTDNGDFGGTWIYVNRDYMFALWLSEHDGKPIARIRFQGNGNLIEAFETDWEGLSNYSVQGYPARFNFRLNEADPDLLKASWDWDLDFRGSARREKGEVEVYRSGDGRQLVMNFLEFERVIESTSGDRRFALPQVWTFRKLSKRLVLWEELPF